METLPYTLIRSPSQYESYCERLKELSARKQKSRAQLETIDLLRLLIKRWDDEQLPLSDTDPVEFLRSLMAQHNLKSSELAVNLGISKSLLSDILHYRRRLSREVIRKLASRFQVSQELLNKPYRLVAAAKPAKSPKVVKAPGPSQPQRFTRFPQDQLLVGMLRERSGKATIVRLTEGKEMLIWDVVAVRKILDPASYLISNVKYRMEEVSSEIFFTTSIKELIDRDSGEVIYRA